MWASVLLTAKLFPLLLARETFINLEFPSAEFEGGCIFGVISIICESGIGIRVGFKADTLVFESIILSRMHDTPMNHLVYIFSEDFERQSVTNIVRNSNPPSRLLL